MGISFGRGFGKKLDQGVQASEWFKKLPNPIQSIVKRLLDFTHHYWAGLLLVLYAPIEELRYFGLGVFVDDWPDIPRRYRALFNLGPFTPESPSTKTKRK